MLSEFFTQNHPKSSIEALELIISEMEKFDKTKNLDMNNYCFCVIGKLNGEKSWFQYEIEILDFLKIKPKEKFANDREYCYFDSQSVVEYLEPSDQKIVKLFTRAICYDPNYPILTIKQWLEIANETLEELKNEKV